MSNQITIPGIHHITAISSSASDTLHFYGTVLGLRLVKKTVNFDDPTTYHLYFGDYHGTPGTIMTFFPWEDMPRGRLGSGMISAVAFSVPAASMDGWQRRLAAQGIATDRAERFGETVLRFVDPDGLPLALIGVDVSETGLQQDQTLQNSDTAILGIHSTTTTVTHLDSGQTALLEMLGLTRHAQTQRRIRFKMGPQRGPAHYLDMLVEPDASPGRSGSGTVHHIAFRVRNDHEQALMQTQLREMGMRPTGVRDRNYFRSIYFSSPSGVLYEIATDNPGFDVDEPLETLGATLKLPPQFESQRNQIEQHLSPLGANVHHHVYRPSGAQADDGHTVVALHGTGGSEHDLVPLTEQIFGPAALISPRGTVMENGMPRFFERTANNVFDPRTVQRRADELTAFLGKMAVRYHRDPARFIACGYSNGANIAAAILLLHPDAFDQAILIRPMAPLQVSPPKKLNGKRILVLRGATDTVIPSHSTDALLAMLRAGGAEVTVHTTSAGHAITAEDIDVAHHWYTQRHQAVNRSSRPTGASVAIEPLQ